VRINFISAERLLHSFKTAIATCGAYLVARMIGEPSSQWIIISVIVVMCAQIYVGGMLQKSYLRLLGTLLGCLVASATILLLGHSFLTVLIAVTLAAFLFSYLATTKDSFNQMGTLGAVTTIIILLSSEPTLSVAVMRFFEISIGIMIAALVSQFIFPIHARTHLRRAQAATLAQIKDYYINAVTVRATGSDYNSHDSDESIVRSLLIQRQLANDSAKELVGKRFDPHHFASTLYCEREILRSINFMDMAMTKIVAADATFQQPASLQSFHQAVTCALDVLIHTLKTNNPLGSHIHLPQKQQLLTALNTINADQQLYIDGFIFAAEVLLTNLGALATLYSIPMTPAPLPT
jgi:uncharacterized membrane protein YccC